MPNRQAFNVLRNALEFSGVLSESRRRRPEVQVDEGLEAVTYVCQVERDGDAWRIGDLMGRRFPEADIRIGSEPNGTFVIAVSIRSLAREWGAKALPPG